MAGEIIKTSTNCGKLLGALTGAGLGIWAAVEVSPPLQSALAESMSDGLAWFITVLLDITIVSTSSSVGACALALLCCCFGCAGEVAVNCCSGSRAQYNSIA